MTSDNAITPAIDEEFQDLRSGSKELHEFFSPLSSFATSDGEGTKMQSSGAWATGSRSSAGVTTRDPERGDDLQDNFYSTASPVTAASSLGSAATEDFSSFVSDASPQHRGSTESVLSQLKEIGGLSGTWEGIPHSIEGFEEFLTVTGVGWAKKQLAKSLINTFKPRQEISNKGNLYLIVVKQPIGAPDTKEFLVDGPSFQSTWGADKALGTGQATWEGDHLVMRTKMADASKCIGTEQHRYLEDGKLFQTDKIMMANGKSATLRRAFRRS